MNTTLTLVGLVAAYIVLVDIYPAAPWVLDAPWAPDIPCPGALYTPWALCTPGNPCVPEAAGSAVGGVCCLAAAPVAEPGGLVEVCWCLVVREGVQRRILEFPGLALETFYLGVGSHHEILPNTNILLFINE